jgi:carnitine-CoA ligase
MDLVNDRKMNYVNPFETVRGLLEASASNHPDHVCLRFDSEALTYRQLNDRVNVLANGLLSSGVRHGDRIAVMLGHHIDHVVTFFALTKIGATLIPINVNLRGEPLEYLLGHSQPSVVFCESTFEAQVVPAIRARMANAYQPQLLIWLGHVPAEIDTVAATSFDRIVAKGSGHAPHVSVQGSDVLAICYTSGTTGAPKGALITDTMYRASAVGSLALSGVEDDDVLLFWEPMYHLFGIEVLVLSVMKKVTLGMIERFSASKFWDQARHYRATHIHYVGGVPQLLMKQPESAIDAQHHVRVAWGGGCPIGIWRAFEARFGLHMRDSFGMTETASLNIINVEGEPGALGRPLPYFEARIVDENGFNVSPGVTGELLIRGKEPGLVTPGYYNNPQATASAIRDGWLYTGDLVRQDSRGIYFFVGRKKDSIRRRGENISAWEIEKIINAHPDIEESALIAVQNEFGDEEIKAFLKLRSSGFEPTKFKQWCLEKMAKYQVPRFIALVEHFPKTPTQRIMKHQLSRSVTDGIDLDSLPT